MASAWGIFKARRMRGVDERGNFYRLWYVAWKLEPDEVPVAGWWALPVPGSKLEVIFRSGGNLVLTDRRLLWEPLRTDLRLVYGQDGVKQMVNALGTLQERVAAAEPAQWPLGRLQAAPVEGKKVAVRISADGPQADYYFAESPAFRGSAEKRAQFIQRISEAHKRS